MNHAHLKQEFSESYHNVSLETLEFQVASGQFPLIIHSAPLVSPKLTRLWNSRRKKQTSLLPEYFRCCRFGLRVLNRTNCHCKVLVILLNVVEFLVYSGSQVFSLVGQSKKNELTPIYQLPFDMHKHYVSR